MKKVIAVLLVFIFVFLAGCGNGSDGYSQEDLDAAVNAALSSALATTATTTTAQKSTTTTAQKSTAATTTTKNSKPDIASLITTERLYGDDGKMLSFTFFDENDNQVKAAATVKLRIVNDAGVTVYSATKYISEADFSWALDELRADIHITYNEMAKGSSEYGNLYYQVTTSAGDYFSESYIPIGRLPTQERLTLPSTPIAISFFINGQEQTRFDLTSLSYEVIPLESNYFNLAVYFSGTKTFDRKGEKAENYCAYAYKLYDSNGTLVREGDNIVEDLRVGQRFIDEKITFYDLPAEGTYRLEMVSFDYEYHIDF